MLNLQQSKHPLSGWILKNRLVSNAIFAGFYLLLCMFGNWLGAYPDHVTPIWPASGLAVAAVLIAGRTLLPGLFIAGLANSLIGGFSLFASLSVASGALLEAYVAYLLLRPARALSELLGSYTIPGWIITSSIFAPILSAFLGIFGQCYLINGAEGEWNSELWRIWWLSNAVGIVVFAPVCLYLNKIQLGVHSLLRLIGLITVSAIAYTLIFRAGSDTPILFLAFAVLLLACNWFGTAGCAISTLFFAVFSVIANAHGAQANMDYHNYVESILLFDIFLLVLGYTSLALSSFHRKERFVIPSIILLTGWVISGWLYYALHSASARIDDISFKELVADSENSILNRYNSYVDALRASAAFYQETQDLSRTEWRNFVDYLELENRYPGVSGLGVIVPVKDHDLDDYVASVRQSGLTNFTVKKVPGAERPETDRLGFAHYIVDRIEPIENNPRMLGLDVASEAKRQAAGAVSRDTGNPAISESIDLIQNQKSRKGFLLFMPIYRKGMSMETIDQRRDAFMAWTYAPFVTDAFFDGILRQKSNKVDFAVFDKEQISQTSLVYKTNADWDPLSDLNFEHLTKLDLGEQRYAFAWKRGSGFSRSEVYSASIAAASLALGTCFLAGIVVSLQSTSRSANRIVEIRTAELRQVNDTLREEVQDRKRAEEHAEAARKTAEAANLAKSEFLATMSHEIRTPMNSVLGFSELLYSSELSAEQRLWTSYIRGSGQSLLAIINDILDFSKIEAGKMELERIPFSPYQAIEEVRGSFSTTANEKGLNLELQAAPNLPDRVIGDPIRFKQIATNLIGNGIKFTEKGSVSVKIEWEGSADNGTLVTRIVDTGVGIHPEKLNTLFEKFTQVDSSTTRKFGGTGLGLAICKKLIELMDGTIEANSTLDEGTTMTVKIPFKASVEEKTAPKEAKPDEQSTPKEPSKYDAEVLLVDDNAVNRKLGMTILQRMGCNVTLACNGQEAVEAAKLKEFSIIFMDCRMPVMDGFDATRNIRKLESEGAIKSDKMGKLLPILALTANVTSENRQECLDSGMNDHLRKPCKIGDFKMALDTYHLELKADPS